MNTLNLASESPMSELKNTVDRINSLIDDIKSNPCMHITCNGTLSKNAAYCVIQAMDRIVERPLVRRDTNAVKFLLCH